MPVSLNRDSPEPVLGLKTNSPGEVTAPIASRPDPPNTAQIPDATPAHRHRTQGPRGGRIHHAAFGRRAALVEVRAASAREVPRSTGWNFDWDDNIFNMPTTIRVTHKVTGEELGITTAEFALVRELIGKSGRYADYVQKPDALRFFGDDPRGVRNYFVEDVARAMAASAAGWQGPSWDAFVTAMSRPDTAARTTLITARLHSPATLHAGLVHLQQLGLIKHVPPVENIFPVSYPPLAEKLGGSANSPSAAKAKVMMQILDRLQAEALSPRAKPVTAPDGKGRRVMHLWGFSDDDWGNYRKAVDALLPEVRAGRWPDVKITVFFTGKNHPGEPPRIEVLSKAGPRPARPEEIKAALYRQARTRAAR
jgi:hypothetical protein